MILQGIKIVLPGVIALLKCHRKAFGLKGLLQLFFDSLESLKLCIGWHESEVWLGEKRGYTSQVMANV